MYVITLILLTLINCFYKKNILNESQVWKQVIKYKVFEIVRVLESWAFSFQTLFSVETTLVRSDPRSPPPYILPSPNC